MEIRELFGRPTLNPLPAIVEDLDLPKVSLNGRWKLNLNPGEGFWKADCDGSLSDVRCV